MAVNKVVYGGETVVDLTTDTVTAAKMLSGITAHDKSGAKITGTIATKTASNMTASGATVTAPAGYYASAASKSVATATQATPSISVDSAGLITASATQSAGYVSAGTKSATKQLTVQAAQTITPTTADQTIASGKYLTGAQTIKGDANLLPENIASGVSIFGVTGTLEAGSGDGGEATDYVVLTNNTDTLLVFGGIMVDAGESVELPLTINDGQVVFIILAWELSSNAVTVTHNGTASYKVNFGDSAINMSMPAYNFEQATTLPLIYLILSGVSSGDTLTFTLTE